MVTDHVCSPIVLAVILFREFAVAGVRMLAAETGTVIAANMWGKVKTVLQMLTIIFYYFVGALAGPTDVGFVSFVTMVLCWLCGAATLLSGGIYLWQNRKLFMQARPAALPYMPFYIRCRAGHVRPLQGNGPNKETPTCQSSISVHF